jgi:DNA-binding IclR family transcriptional regulator
MSRVLQRKRNEVLLPRGRYAAPALDKGLDILEVFASEAAGLTGSEVARRLGRSVSEIFRMLVRLERRGYICQSDSSDRMELTLKLFELAHKHHPLDRILLHARPLLQEVASQVNQSCHLAMLSNGAVVVVAQADAPGSMGFSLRLGAQVQLLDTASGHVILAFLSTDARKRALESWQRYARRRMPSGLRRHLVNIRARGYERMPSYQVRGVTNFSYPVFNQHGEAIAAMSVPFLERIGERIRVNELQEALLSASDRLTAGIGGRRVALLPEGRKRP